MLTEDQLDKINEELQLEWADDETRQDWIEFCEDQGLVLVDGQFILEAPNAGTTLKTLSTLPQKELNRRERQSYDKKPTSDAKNTDGKHYWGRWSFLNDPVKRAEHLKRKSLKAQTSLAVDDDDRVAVGNKPKSKVYDKDAGKGPKMMTSKGQQIVIDLRPTVDLNAQIGVAKATTGPKRVIIPIREDHSILTGENPFATQKSQRETIVLALKNLSYETGIDWSDNISFDAWVSMLNKAGYDVTISIQ